MALNFKYISVFKRTPNIVSGLLKIRTLRILTRSCAKSQDDSEDLDKPIQYSKSSAARWKAQFSRTGAMDEYPWYQTYVIVASLSVFMIYFFILREESDIDLEFDKTLYDRIQGLEEKQLEVVVDYNISRGLPYDEEMKRLQELRKDE